MLMKMWIAVVIKLRLIEMLINIVKLVKTGDVQRAVESNNHCLRHPSFYSVLGVFIIQFGTGSRSEHSWPENIVVIL